MTVDPTSNAFDIEIDVLVVGAGGCGLVAAIAAEAGGASVAVVEKLTRLAGNTLLSSGSIPGAGTRLQAEAGVEDGPERFIADLLAVSGPHEAEHLTRRLAATSAELVEWLIDEAHVTLTLVGTYRHVGHSVTRLHAPPSRRGADLVADLEREASARGIPVALGQPATSLILRGGRVVGVVTRDAEGRESRIGAGAVILASNGFGGAPDLVAAHCPEARGTTYAGAPGSTGEALAWGLELGAATGNLGAYQGHAGLARRSGALVTWTVIERGGIIVDRNGRRIGDETLGYSAFAGVEAAADAPLYMIYDARIEADVASGQPEFAEIAEMGDAAAGADAADLADAIGVHADALGATLADAANAAAGGEDAFGRTAWGFGPLGAPLRATEITPGLFHTQGGLMIDDDARVLRPDGSAIAGLFAGGGAAAGISGRAGGRGYVSGNGLLSALGLGYIAGRAAARDTAAKRAAE
ncbi:FAD-dependent oxidoreductase [Acuticoccus sediminis]|uniref:FAD-dependent oxidoreductase n=1 Tax=Acuticoccus sediminis TaxID=2184697 RepID=UPI001CFE3814|nr:FAD-dependent oxidoreductase [Acuticoccus sediminis]